MTLMPSDFLSSHITLRPATPADAAQAAPLIYGAGPALYDRLFGPTDAEAIAFFETLFALPGSIFSFENAVVAERNGRVVGLAHAVQAAQYHRGNALPRQMLRRGLLFLLRLLPVVFALSRSTKPPPPDALYLGLLSVAPDLRGAGIGTQLLEDVHRRAAEAKCACVCLHAELGNTGARRLYERQGYTVIAEYPTPRAARWGVTGFVGMRREIRAGE
jgi:ribosomal protein S18 acetylase RimI-like enzyme